MRLDISIWQVYHFHSPAMGGFVCHLHCVVKKSHKLQNIFLLLFPTTTFLKSEDEFMFTFRRREHVSACRV